MVNRPRFNQKQPSQPSKPSKELREEQNFESTLSQEQLQSLEEENNSLLEGFERTMDQIK